MYFMQKAGESGGGGGGIDHKLDLTSPLPLHRHSYPDLLYLNEISSIYLSVLPPTHLSLQGTPIRVSTKYYYGLGFGRWSRI